MILINLIQISLCSVIHPYLPHSPEPGISVYRAPPEQVTKIVTKLVTFLLTSSKTQVANVLTHHIAAKGLYLVMPGGM